MFCKSCILRLVTKQVNLDCRVRYKTFSVILSGTGSTVQDTRGALPLHGYVYLVLTQRSEGNVGGEYGGYPHVTASCASENKIATRVSSQNWLFLNNYQSLFGECFPTTKHCKKTWWSTSGCCWCFQVFGQEQKKPTKRPSAYLHNFLFFADPLLLDD